MSEKQGTKFRDFLDSVDPNSLTERQNTLEKIPGDREKEWQIITGTTPQGIRFRLKAVVFADTEENAVPSGGGLGRVGQVAYRDSVQGTFTQDFQGEQVMDPNLALKMWQKLRPSSLG